MTRSHGPAHTAILCQTSFVKRPKEGDATSMPKQCEAAQRREHEVDKCRRDGYETSRGSEATLEEGAVHRICRDL